jgi:beta-N-acetylhexosaminidase
MGMSAANSTTLVTEVGKAIALSGRAGGIHWTLGPVCDLNLNPNNPVTNTRAFGDEPGHVAKMAAAFIRGIQAGGMMAATAKHFPGDGVDDRDQHHCTSINSLSRTSWERTFGQVWQAVFKAGVMSVMTGHIALPWKDKDTGDYRGPLPGSLSAKIQVDLLRKALGFEGVIVSDALPMIGFSAHVKKGEEALANFLAGGDVILFANPVTDFKRLCTAFKDKEFTEKRLDQSVLRVLRMKAALGLLDGPPPGRAEPVFGAKEKAAHRVTAQRIADRSVTLVRDATGVLPLKLEKGAKVLTITIGHDIDAPWYGDKEFTVVDRELTARGFVVEHLRNPQHYDIFAKLSEYAAVFVNIKTRAHCIAGTIRLGPQIMTFWRAFWTEHEKVVFTSFGNPYLIHEFPQVPAMVNMYYWTDEAQRAAVKVWLGEMKAQGVCPVRLDKRMVAK